MQEYHLSNHSYIPNFTPKDLDQLKYFLGVEVTRNKKEIFLSQMKYVLDLLTKTGKLGAISCSTPIVLNVHLIKNDGDLLDDPKRYK